MVGRSTDKDISARPVVTRGGAEIRPSFWLMRLTKTSVLMEVVRAIPFHLLRPPSFFLLGAPRSFHKGPVCITDDKYGSRMTDKIFTT